MELRDRVRRVARAWRAQERAPRLSVVVPVYNVRDYLAECLDSILGQSLRDLEVVVVDDGSTDGSRALAQDYVDRFPNVRLIATENRGLGAARNTGVGHSRGELIAFADSDDMVLPEAYAVMASVLDQSGSDFVVGTFQRNFPEGVSIPHRQRMLHRERRLAITAEDFPEILSDVFAWNKLFRREFWERGQLSFPEGVRYEDQPTLTRAYLSARAFDVIERPVYLWRIRDDASSITQGKRQLDDLRDRFITKRDALETVRRRGSASLLATFFRDSLVVDLPGYFRQIPYCDDEWWELLHRELRDLWGDGPSFTLTSLPVTHRLIAWLVVNNRRAEAATVMAFAEPRRPVDLPVEDLGDHMVAKLPYWDDPSTGIPRELYRLQDHERNARLSRQGDAARDVRQKRPRRWPDGDGKSVRRIAQRARLALRRPRPRLSVVVPIYNVEQYLAEAVDSLLAQTYDDLELVMVDDGSTDTSHAIAEDYARRYPNVHLIATENHGLGAARNLGVRHARGEFLAFVDSDDTVPAKAYAKMMETLDQTESDFVVGAMQRRRGNRHLPLTRRQAMLHRERRLKVTTDEFPEILADVFAPNKVFRRSFWDRTKMSFPEGVRYEDQVALTRAFLLASSFDVIRAPVYLWRQRDDRTSLTQRRHELLDLRDRLATKWASLDLVRRYGSAEVLQQFYIDALAMDLPGYFWQIPRSDDTYWQVLSGGVRDLWADGPPFQATTLPVQHRLVAWLVAQGRRTDAETVLDFVERHRPDLPVRDCGDHAISLLPYWDDRSTGIPEDLYWLTGHDKLRHDRTASPAAEADTEPRRS